MWHTAHCQLYKNWYICIHISFIYYKKLVGKIKIIILNGLCHLLEVLALCSVLTTKPQCRVNSSARNCISNHHSKLILKISVSINKTVFISNAVFQWMIPDAASGCSSSSDGTHQKFFQHCCGPSWLDVGGGRRSCWSRHIQIFLLKTNILLHKE